MKPEKGEKPTSELKSSFPSTFGYKPWLMQHGASNKSGQVFVDPFTATTTTKKIKSLESKICLGSYQEWLLLVRESSNEAFLFSHISNTEIRLPAIQEQLKSLGGFVLSSEPTSPKCTIVVASKGQNFIIHCGPNGSQWTKVPFPKSGINIMGQIVIHKEKLYILASGKYDVVLLVINMKALQSGIIEYSIIRGPYNYSRFAQFQTNDHLVVYGEDILFVSIHFFLKELQELEAYLLDTSNIYLDNCCRGRANRWTRVELIRGHHVFFFSEDYNMSFVPNNADMKLNCIFLLKCEHSGEKIYRINLDGQIVSSVMLPKRLSTDWNRSSWVVPSRARTRKEKSTSCQSNGLSEKCKVKVTKKGGTIIGDTSRPWADLPIELVQLLLPHLGLSDCIRLPTICRAWSDLSNPALEAKTWPLLMYFSNDCNTCRLFDPICNQEYSLDMKWFTEGKACTLQCSKDGWVFVSKGKHYYVVNPFTRETIDVPFHDFNHPCSFSFCSSPTSEDFMIFGTYGNHEMNPKYVYYWWPGESSWSTEWASQNDFHLHMGWSNPVYFEEEFFCLGRRGDVGVIDPCARKTTWDIYETSVHSDTPEEGTEDCYLLELDGELISVFRERTKHEVRIFKLDDDEWRWNKQEDLEDLTLFLDRRGSVAKKLKLGRCYANRIYFPGFYVEGDCKTGAYYSVDSARYNSRFDKLQKPLNYVWFEPNLRVNKDSAQSM